MQLMAPVLLRFIMRIGRKDFFWHLLIPVVGGIGGEFVVSSLVAHSHGAPLPGLGALPRYVFSWERAGLLAGIFLTFALVLYFQIQIEADIGMRNIGLAVLRDALKGAKSYLAIAAIPLREWFEPATQTYFATIVGYQLTTPVFRHHRVLVAFTQSDSFNLGSALMDEYHAKAFIRLHERLGARLAYLEREHIFEILDGLSVADRKAIGCYLPWQTWIPDSILRRVSISRLRRRIRRLAVAIIEYADGRPPCFIVFSKNRHEVGIRRLTGDQSAPYAAFFDAVKQEVFEAHSGAERPTIRAERDFMQYYT